MSSKLCSEKAPVPEDTGTEGNRDQSTNTKGGNHLILQTLILRSQHCAYFKKMVVVVVVIEREELGTGKGEDEEEREKEEDRGG